MAKQTKEKGSETAFRESISSFGIFIRNNGEPVSWYLTNWSPCKTAATWLRVKIFF